MHHPEIIKALLHLVEDEVDRQDTKWGEQDHPVGNSSVIYKDLSDHYRNVCDAKHADGGYETWLDILREEFWEAFAEDDLRKVQTELVQVAAVALSIVRNILTKE